MHYHRCKWWLSRQWKLLQPPKKHLNWRNLSMITETIKKLNTKLEDAEKEGITILESHLDADSDLKMKESHILLTTSKKDWKKLGITNEAGRKAYIRKECEELQKKVDHTGLQLEINKTMQKSLKRRLNFCMTLLQQQGE